MYRKRWLRRCPAFGLAIGFVLLPCPPSGANDEPLALTAEQRRLNLESFDYVWSTVREKHWDPELGGIDWQAAREEFRPRVAQATTMPLAREALVEMLDRLDQSHFGIIPGEIYRELALPEGEGTTGIDLRVLEGRAVVTSVGDGTPADRAGIRPGWIITRIGSERIAPVLEKVAEQFRDSRYLDLALAGVAMSRLGGVVGDELEVRFLDARNRKTKRLLTLVEQKGHRLQYGFLPPIHVWIDAKPIESNIGYIAFNMFIDPVNVMTRFNQAMQEFMEFDGLVIDVRGNPGGVAGMALGMAGWLVAEENRYLGTMYTRDNDLRLVVFPRATIYPGPVAVLVDGLSGSCSEIFAGGLQDLGRARVFGSRTMGAVLNSAIEQLPNGDGFQYAFADYVSADGRALEGHGVIPDTEVALTREALLRGRDPVIDAAVTWIREQTRSSTKSVSHKEVNTP